MSQFRTKLFPFCEVPDDGGGVGDGLLHPFATTRDKCMEWYWRVKKWTVEIDFSSIGTITFNNLVFEVDGIPPASERDLICLNQEEDPTPARRFFTSGQVSGEDYSVDIEAHMFSPFVNTVLPSTDISEITDPLRTFDGDHYPEFHFGVQATGDELDGFTFLFMTFEKVGTTNVGLLLNFDGHFIRCYADTLGDITEVRFSPQEWWEYRPTSGGDPVFDSATGTQINPLVVID